MMLILTWLLVGAVLGHRFKVLVLIPMLAFVIGSTAAFVQDDTFAQIFSAIAGAAGALQIGYLAGAGIHSVVTAARIGRAPVKSTTAMASPRRVVN